MIRFLLKNFLLLSFLFLASCSFFKKTDSSNKIRIVDLQGKSRNVKTRVPILNAKMIESQNRMMQNGGDFASPVSNDPTVNNSMPEVNQPVEGNKYATADYAAASSEIANQRLQNSPQNNLSSQELQPVENQPSKIVAGKIEPETDVTVEYDLSNEKAETSSSDKTFILTKYKIPSKNKKSSSTNLGSTKIESAKSSNLSGIFVQTGAFSSRNNAEKSAKIMKKYAKVQIEESNNGKIYRVLLGSFSNTTQANKTVSEVKKAGYDAIIVRKR